MDRNDIPASGQKMMQPGNDRNRKQQRGRELRSRAKMLLTAALAAAVVMVTVYFVGVSLRSEDLEGDGNDTFADSDTGTDGLLALSNETAATESNTETAPNDFYIGINYTPDTNNVDTSDAVDTDDVDGNGDTDVEPQPSAAVTPVNLTAEHEHKWIPATCTLPAVCRICGREGESAHGHVWSGPTCTSASVCEVCGYRGEGASGHKWIEATCEHPKMCTVCGETEGEKTPHSWAAATCTKPKTCTVCGATKGEPNGHKWKKATCTTPEICTVCGKTQGKAKGHTWVAASTSAPKRCSVCGATEGDKLPDGGKVSALKYDDDDVKMLAALIYLEASGSSYDGRWAVGTVVVNRVRSSKFANTVEGVIYAKGQFTVANRIASTTPSQSCIEIAKKCLDGELYDKSILYFKSSSSSKSWGSRKYCFKVGNNYFYT